VRRYMSLRSVLSLVRSAIISFLTLIYVTIWTNISDIKQSWILAMHSSRFTKTGDYFRIDIAGFPIILIHGKDGTIQAFHNVCRHRAYPIVNKESGSSLVLGAFALEELR
jgi:hypothetical protein